MTFPMICTTCGWGYGDCTCAFEGKKTASSAAITNRLLERIAIALETIAAKGSSTSVVDPKALTNPRAGRYPKKKPIELNEMPVKNDVQLLIKAYIDCFRQRYGPNARPDVGGKVQGLMRTMLKDHPLPRLIALVQAYCQMRDEWFDKKCHDFPTLHANIGKVQTALLNGTMRAGDAAYWSKVFKDEKNGKRQIEKEISGQSPQGQKLLGMDGSDLV